MARLRRAYPPPGVITAPEEEVVPIRWRPLPYPAVWQEIGAFDQPPLNNRIAIYPGPQRRNGVGDISSRYNVAYPPEWTNVYPVITPGTQRQTGAPNVQGPSRYSVYKMRRAVTAAQVAQAGASLLPFLQNSENPVIGGGNNG
jgi:hypothetical protein